VLCSRETYNEETLGTKMNFTVSRPACENPSEELNRFWPKIVESIDNSLFLKRYYNVCMFLVHLCLIMGYNLVSPQYMG